MASQNVYTFTDENFETEVLQSPIPVLVDFTATWCGPCKVLAPIVERLAEELQGKVKVGKLDVDAAPQTASKFGIRGVPTCMIFEGGQKKTQHVGVAKREQLMQMLGL